MDTSAPIIEVLSSLTPKQCEMLELVAEGLTGKEIAAQLDISHSAVSQRIETLRNKFGGLTKNEIARIYRQHLADRVDQACIEDTGQKNHLPHREQDADERPWAGFTPTLTFADSMSFDASPPWSMREEVKLVPKVLNGENAIAARWAYVAVAAVGMTVMLLVLLAVASTIGDLV